MIVLAVDPGLRRIGFAICDPMGMIASPLKTARVSGLQDAVPAVLATIAETGAERVVVGYPRNMNGKPGTKALESQQLADALRAEGVEVVLWDERLTTAEAERLMAPAGLSRKERMKHIDAVAAQRILQAYLAGGQPGPENA